MALAYSCHEIYQRGTDAPLVFQMQTFFMQYKQTLQSMTFYCITTLTQFIYSEAELHFQWKIYNSAYTSFYI